MSTIGKTHESHHIAGEKAKEPSPLLPKPISASPFIAPESVAKEHNQTPDDVCAQNDRQGDHVDDEDRVKGACRRDANRIAVDRDTVLECGDGVLLRDGWDVGPLGERHGCSFEIDRRGQGRERTEIGNGRADVKELVHSDGFVVRRQLPVDVVDSGESSGWQRSTGGVS